MKFGTNFHIILMTSIISFLSATLLITNFIPYILGTGKNCRIMSYSPKFSSPIFTDTAKMYFGICTDCSLFTSPITFTCMVHQNFPLILYYIAWPDPISQRMLLIYRTLILQVIMACMEEGLATRE